MSNTNVFQFPKENPRAHLDNPIPENEEELNKRKEEFQKNYVDFLAGEVMGQVIHMLAHEGFQLNSPEMEPETYLFVDSFYSMLYKSLGYDHELQQAAINHFTNKGLDKGTPV